MRVVRAFRIPITAIITAFVLSGCMRTTGPVAAGPQGDLDSMAYGQPYNPPPRAVAMNSGGGAIGALRSAFAASPRAVSAPPPEQVAYAEPMPVAAPACRARSVPASTRDGFSSLPAVRGEGGV